MFKSLKNLIIFFINDIRNFVYQKLKYKKNYLFFSNLEDIKKHERNFYEDSIKNRTNSEIINTEKIDINKLTFDNSINLNDPINPLVLTVNEILKKPSIKLNQTSVFDFFNKFKPKSLSEVFFFRRST